METQGTYRELEVQDLTISPCNETKRLRNQNGLGSDFHSDTSYMTAKSLHGSVSSSAKQKLKKKTTLQMIVRINNNKQKAVDVVSGTE